METNNKVERKMKICKHCKLEVDARATKCPHCHGKLFVWTVGNVTLLAILGMFLLMFIAVASQSDEVADSASQTGASQPPPSIQKIQLTESQCMSVRNEFYSFVSDKPYEKTQLGKELLEQYAVDGGMSVKKTNPNIRYIFPSSKCGDDVDGILKIIIIGEKKRL